MINSVTLVGRMAGDAEIWTDDNFNIIKRVSFEHGGLSGNENYKIELNISEIKLK